MGSSSQSQDILMGLAPFKTASGGYHLKNNTHYMIVET